MLTAEQVLERAEKSSSQKIDPRFEKVFALPHGCILTNSAVTEGDRTRINKIQQALQKMRESGCLADVEFRIPSRYTLEVYILPPEGVPGGQVRAVFEDNIRRIDNFPDRHFPQIDLQSSMQAA